MPVRSLKDGLERIRKLLMSSGVEGDTPEEKLKSLGMYLDLSLPTEEYLVGTVYHGPNPSVLNKSLHKIREDLSHRGPEAWKAKGLPDTPEGMKEYLREVEEELKKRIQEKWTLKVKKKEE